MNLKMSVFVALLLGSSIVCASPKNQADFEPVILYQDADYIAKQGANSAAATSMSASSEQASSGSVAAAKSESSAAAAGAGDMLSQNYLVFGVVIALVGLIFWSNRSAPQAPSVRSDSNVPPPPPAAVSGGATGVAKYMAKHGGAAVGAAATGVARYLEKHVATVKETAAVTGVAKYLKNRDMKG